MEDLTDGRHARGYLSVTTVAENGAIVHRNHRQIRLLMSIDWKPPFDAIRAMPTTKNCSTNRISGGHPLFRVSYVCTSARRLERSGKLCPEGDSVLATEACGTFPKHAWGYANKAKECLPCLHSMVRFDHLPIEATALARTPSSGIQIFRSSCTSVVPVAMCGMGRFRHPAQYR